MLPRTKCGINVHIFALLPPFPQRLYWNTSKNKQDLSSMFWSRTTLILRHFYSYFYYLLLSR